MPHELDPRVMFPETAEFWEAASENRFLIKRCDKCGEAHFYPRVHCPFCHSAATKWEELSGKGTIYAFTVQRSLTPLRATAVIDIGDDVRIHSAIVDADLGKLRIGQEVCFAPIEGGLVPEIAFTTPASRSAMDYAARVISEAHDLGEARTLVGNRMAAARDKEARQLLIEGATVQQVDRVLVQFGMPKGSVKMTDMPAGSARRIADDEIEERLVLIQLHEGIKLLGERVTPRAGDIDAVCVQGYGWPAWRGGPMYYADDIGLPHIHDRLQVLAQAHGERYIPCDLLVRLVREARSLTAKEPKQ